MTSTRTFVDPESVLARTARETAEAHTGETAICPACGEPLPCASGRAAAEVLLAAGLAESSGLVAAARQGRGPDAGHTAQHSQGEQPAAADKPQPKPTAPKPTAPKPQPPKAEGRSGLPEGAGALSGLPEGAGGLSGHHPAPSAETVRGTARPLAEPAGKPREPGQGIDPLELGPPLFDQQNRPLDAPDFTRTPRPGGTPRTDGPPGETRTWQ
jgi:hypothetical protein